MYVRETLPLMALTAALATGTGLAARAQQGSLPQISAPGQIGPKPPVGSGGCSVKGPTCAEVAPAIIHSALGPSPLAQDVHYLIGAIGASGTGAAVKEQVVQWAAQAFRKAGVDEVHLEAYATAGRGRFRMANVVAEIRGREKPTEFVILGAHLDSGDSGSAALDDAHNAALVIDAARAIHAAGVPPLRSIRFILFSGKEQGMTGSWAYTRAHRSEMDHADAAIIFDGGNEPVIGYHLDGRRSLEAPLRKALAPAAQFGADHDTYTAELDTGGFDFLLEGVPTIVANRRTGSNTPGTVDLPHPKRDVALAALTAYGIADLPERLGTRQTRIQIEQLIKKNGLEDKMKILGIWSEWKHGERGRRP